MIRLFKNRRALLAELAESQTAFNDLAASFARHRKATGDRAVALQHRINVLEQAIDRMRPATGVGMARPARPRYDGMAARLRAQPLPADLVDAIDEETTAKRYLDGLGD